MRALLQRVRQGAVHVDGRMTGQTGPGYVIFLGVGRGDSQQDAAWLAQKTANLRVFEDEQGRFNLSLLDMKGSALVVSQFTLYADCRRGNRPGFEQAAPPQEAEYLYQEYVQLLRAQGIVVETGVFQAHMLVELVNDGPATFLLESPPHK